MGCLGCVEEIGGSIQMRYFRLFGLSLTNSWIYVDALFCVVSVMLKKSADLFGCVILGCLGCVQQILRSIRMHYFLFFGLC